LDKHQILEQLQHIIAVYNQILRAGGLPSELREEVDEGIEHSVAIYEKLLNAPVLDYKHYKRTNQ